MLKRTAAPGFEGTYIAENFAEPTKLIMIRTGGSADSSFGTFAWSGDWDQHGTWQQDYSQCYFTGTSGAYISDYYTMSFNEYVLNFYKP